MKTLFVAFKGNNNTSFHLVSRLNERALFLTNSFTGLEKDITSFDCDFDTIYMFGIDKELANEIRIEFCACYNGEHMCTGFDLLPLERKLNEVKFRIVFQKLQPNIYVTPHIITC